MSQIAAIPALSTVAIGSVPFTSVEETLDLLGRCIDIPAWPQMVALSPWEDMLFGALKGLPALTVDLSARRVTAEAEGREDDLTRFYELFLQSDYEFLAPAEESARGFYALLTKARRDPSFGPAFLKAQIIGPLTLGQSVGVGRARKLVDDPELLDACLKGLGAKGAWLAGRLRALGRTPVIFLDEPGLSGYGSAFSTLSAEKVLNSLNEAADLIRSQGPALVGLHVCGNSDWGLLSRARLDIINFDSYNYMEPFSLYPQELKDFYRRGGYVAWGQVPTNDFEAGLTTPETLAGSLAGAWEALAAKGLDLEIIVNRALLSSACGLGSLSEAAARAILRTLPELADLLKKRYQL